MVSVSFSVAIADDTISIRLFISIFRDTIAVSVPVRMYVSVPIRRGARTVGLRAIGVDAVRLGLLRGYLCALAPRLG